MFRKRKLKFTVKDVGETFAERAPRTKEHLAVYSATVLNTKLPESPAACATHHSPLDAIWGAYAEEDLFAIWHAMRGSGKTFDIALLAWLESLFKPRCGTTILGGSLEQSTKAVAYLDGLWALPNVPHKMLIGHVAGRGLKLTNGSWIQALAASPKSVRGPHPQKLRLDEVDEMEKKIYEASLGQPKTNWGIRDNIVVSSTLHNPFGMMSEIIDTRDEIGAKLYQWCVEEVRAPRGFWTDEEIERKRKQNTKDTWESEYLLKRPSIGDTVYDYELIEQAYRRGINDVYDPKVITTEAGIDWGHGVTIMHIIQDRKEKFCIPLSFKWELTELTERCEAISDICIKFKVIRIYSDVAPKDSNITLNKILRNNRVRTKVIPVAFNKFKTMGIEVVRFILEWKLLNITDKKFKKTMQEYHYKDTESEVIVKEDDHYPDALTAWAASKSKILGLLQDSKNGKRR